MDTKGVYLMKPQRLRDLPKKLFTTFQSLREKMHFKLERKNLLPHPVKSLIHFNLRLFLVCFIILCLNCFFNLEGIDLIKITLKLIIVFGTLFVPLELFAYNIAYLIKSTASTDITRAGVVIEVITILYGAVCSYYYLNFTNVEPFADWHVRLYDVQNHTPIFTESLPTVITLCAVSLAGYILLRLRRITKLPPLAAVPALSGIYVGMGICITLMIQTYNAIFFTFYLFNLLLIALKLIRESIYCWNEYHIEEPKSCRPVIKLIYRIAKKGAALPFLALILAVPLLGVCIGILCLFGQAPDSIIRAWTETADWTFSTKTPPEPLPYDGHYLCTVAAGGHRKVVKPLRTGKRHGHTVIVNRQLCVANAFEELLTESLPRIHRWIRGVYDRYGYPISRHIRTKVSADVVYLLMKPLEYLFLAVLYLFDEKPENRIAVQYPHSPVPTELKRK